MKRSQRSAVGGRRPSSAWYSSTMAPSAANNVRVDLFSGEEKLAWFHTPDLQASWGRWCGNPSAESEAGVSSGAVAFGQCRATGCCGSPLEGPAPERTGEAILALGLEIARIGDLLWAACGAVVPLVGRPGAADQAAQRDRRVGEVEDALVKEYGRKTAERGCVLPSGRMHASRSGAASLAD